MEIRRINPRQDLDQVVALVRDHCAWQDVPFDENAFTRSFQKRMTANLKVRNGTVVVDDDGTLIGLGLFSILEDALGQPQCFVHPPITRKEHAFRVGIEEGILRELTHYIASTMKLSKANIIFEGSNRNLLSLLMKLDFRKAKGVYYAKDLEK